MYKIALSRIKMHELAKSVGLIDHPQSQWKWALRQMRRANPKGKRDAPLLINKKELTRAKENIGLLPESIRREVADLSREYGHEREIGYYGDINDLVIGGRESISFPANAKGILHTHPKSDDSKYFAEKVKQVNEMSPSIEKEYHYNNLKEIERFVHNPVLEASQSGLNYNRLSPAQLRHLEKVERDAKRYIYSDDFKSLLKRQSELSSRIKSLKQEDPGFLSRTLTFGERWDTQPFYSPEKDAYVKGYFGENTKRAKRLIKELDDVHLNIKERKSHAKADLETVRKKKEWHDEDLSCDAYNTARFPSARNIMSQDYTGVHKYREKLPYGFRTIYFSGGYK